MGWGAETTEQPVRRTGRGAGAFQPGSGSAPSHYEAPAAPVLAPLMAPSSDPYGSAPMRASSYSEPVAQKYAPATGSHAVSSNAFARGANQNAGNVLTDRPTSKVLAPPGGRSSIVFG